MLLKNANDDNTYNFGIKMIWRAVAVSFSEAHPFVFACFVRKIQYLFFFLQMFQLENRHPYGGRLRMNCACADLDSSTQSIDEGLPQ